MAQNHEELETKLAKSNTEIFETLDAIKKTVSEEYAIDGNENWETLGTSLHTLERLNEIKRFIGA